ncbi:tetratricopeptide repeat protein [Lusitaniella coriacea]|uniref:tetratricopeptide repeat protein n=1 Tax=Lusitaniella coriacea TaxID=1983105 RepID=UPI003CEDDBFD
MTKTASPETATLNLQAYQRLQLSLLLGLRRQILIGVCDNSQLRDRLAQQLHDELEKPPRYPHLVSLDLNLENPAFLTQVGQWLKQYPQAQQSKVPCTFQILGIEKLTRQPAIVQRRFLRHLQTIARYLPQLNINLLLWLPRPWFHNVKQSVPEFWRWRTGIFEFEGELMVPPAIQSAIEVLKESLQGVPAKIEDIPESSAIPLSARQGTTSKEGAFPLIKSLKTPRIKEVPAPKLPASEPSETVQPPVERMSLEEIERLEQENYPPETIAAAFIELGNTYRDRVSGGKGDSETLSYAIQAYERGLQWSEDDAPMVANILNDLGNFYWMRSRNGGKLPETLADLEQAVQYYQAAAEKLGSPEAAPGQYAMIQNNLGAAYSDLSRYGESADWLQLSISAYEEALRYRPAAVDPQKYGSTQNNLGTAYWHLAQYQDPLNHLKRAIASYEESLTYYSPETASMQWAMIQNNLGTAYWNLAQYEQPEQCLQRSIECYQASLQYRTPETVPPAHAATQNNLGTTYWHLSELEGMPPEQQQESLERAIAAYQLALSVAEELAHQDPPIPVNFDLAATYNNLGLVRYQLATNDEFSIEIPRKDEYLEAALKDHIQAATLVESPSETYNTTINYMVRAIRLFYQKGDLVGQNRALSLVPGQFLPAILPRL